MTIFNGEVLLPYFPLVLLLLTFEIIITFYRSDSSLWSYKHAVMNLFVNSFWITLFVMLFLNPNIFTPQFIEHISDMYSSTPERVTFIIYFLMGGVIISFIVTNCIDVYHGFIEGKTKNKTDRI